MQFPFEGRSLRLALKQFDRDRLYVVCDHWQKGRRGFAPASDGSLFERRGWSCLRVQGAHNDWFLNRELPAALEAARAVAAGFGRVATFGFSMGGYGALRFARAVGAARVVAVSPQASPDPALTPFETRWPRLRAAARLDLDDLGGLDARNTEVVALYDPREALDAAQMTLLQYRVPGMMALPLPFGGHPATRVVNEGARLGRFLDAALNDPLDPGALLAHHKRARRNSGRYRSALDAALQARARQRSIPGLLAGDLALGALPSATDTGIVVS